MHGRLSVSLGGTYLLWRAVVSLLCLVLCACVTPVQDYPRTASHALSQNSNCEIARLMLGPKGEDRQSWFLPVDNAKDALDWRLALADHATTSIDAQYYIWKSDETARLLMYRLLAAADRGVRVRLLVDDMEVSGDDYNIAAANLHPNLEIRLFNPLEVRAKAKPLRMLNMAFDARQEQLSGMLESLPPLFQQAEAVASQAAELAESLEHTAQSVGRLADRFAPPGETSPWEQVDFPAVLGQTLETTAVLSEAVTQLDLTVQHTQSLLESPAWQKRLEEVDSMARRQYLRIGVLIGMFLVGLLGVVVGSQLSRRRIGR